MALAEVEPRVEGRQGSLNLQPSTLNPFFTRLGTCCRTKANSRMPTPSATGSKRSSPLSSNHPGNREPGPLNLIVTSVTALLQKTFPPGEIQQRTRTLARGDKINPLDLIEWLEEQGCEPEAQVTQKGEIALRGGILDVWPLTSPWPVRLEFFGDELESLRHFDPLTQISRGEIVSVTLPPAGELGLLKREAERGVHAASTSVRAATGLLRRITTSSEAASDASPRCWIICRPETIFLLCEPEQLAIRADEYAQQIPENDPFFVPWTDFLAEMDRRGFTWSSWRSRNGRNPAWHGQIRKRDQRAVPEPALRSSLRSTLFVRSANARRIRKSPRRNAANSSTSFTAGSARTMPFMSSATTTASGNDSRKSGRNS